MSGKDGTGKKSQPNSKRTLVKFRYPKHVCDPEDLLDFIELPCFTKQWQELGLDDEDDLCALQLGIMANPQGHPVIQGTGGLRKLRFAPERWNCGLSGGARVLYVRYEDFGIVLLCLVYSKGETETISPAVRKQVKRLIDEVRRELERRKRL